MQMVKKVILIFLAVFIASLVFAPKKDLYFLLEKELQKNGVVLSDEKIDSNLFGLDITDTKVYVENTYIGDIKNISLLTLLIYSDIDILEFNPVDSIKRVFPLAIKRAKVNYAIWNPFEVKISIDSSVGKINGFIDLNKRRVLLRFLDKNRVHSIRTYLKRDKNGWYYEQSF